MTGVGVVNGLGGGPEAFAAALRRADGVAVTRPVSLEIAAASLDGSFAAARRRWGAGRLALVVGCELQVPSRLADAIRLTGARGPAFAVTTGDRASAQAIVSALGLLRADFADAVAVASRTDTAAAWILLERHGDADVEICRAEERDLVALADAELSEIEGLHDLGPAHGLTCVVAATLALHHGHLLEDRVACRSHGVTVLLRATS